MNTNEIFNQMLSSYDITTELQKCNAIFAIHCRIHSFADVLSDININKHHRQLLYII